MPICRRKRQRRPTRLPIRRSWPARASRSACPASHVYGRAVGGGGGRCPAGEAGDHYNSRPETHLRRVHSGFRRRARTVLLLCRRDGRTLQNVATQVQNDLAGKQGKPTDWTDFHGEAPNGPGNLWRKFRFDGNQDFYYKNKDGQEQFSPQPGVLEVYLHDAGGQVVIVAWRMPASIEQNVGLAKWAPLVAGSVSVKK